MLSNHNTQQCQFLFLRIVLAACLKIGNLLLGTSDIGIIHGPPKTWELKDNAKTQKYVRYTQKAF